MERICTLPAQQGLSSSPRTEEPAGSTLQGPHARPAGMPQRAGDTLPLLRASLLPSSLSPHPQHAHQTLPLLAAEGFPLDFLSCTHQHSGISV